jgi:hypothetical protein
MRHGDTKNKRVAVIAVHGVAHHDPGASANAMADLLLSLPSFDLVESGESKKHYFEGFRSVGIQIPLKPIVIDQLHRVGAADDGGSRPRLKHLLEETAKFSIVLQQENSRSPGQGAKDVDLKYSRRLLQDYQGGADGNAYVTVRLEGKRRNDPKASDVDVNIYEMFWADLARPTNSVVSFLLAVFQLVLHIPSLGRLAVDTHAASDYCWRAYQFAQRYAARIIQIVLPILKLILLIALFAAAPAVATNRNLDILAAGLVWLAGTGLCFLIVNQLHEPVYKKRLTWLLVSFLPGLSLGGVTYRYLHEHFLHKENWKLDQDIVLSLVIWLLGAGLLWFALQAYQNLRPGIRLVGWGVYVAAFVPLASTNERSPTFREKSLNIFSV